MHVNEEIIQTAVLVAVNTNEYDVYESLDELSELASAAGATVVGKIVQNKQSIDKATYVGMGKLLEIKELCELNEANLIIIDDELSGAQIRNIEGETDIKVIDRTMLILDIFAGRALSKEGKLQVELAQQKYLLPRLIGLGTSLSRQGGGIGTRGPGETKLESDRRHIRLRIDTLKRELAQLSKRRETVRFKRSKKDIPVIAIVGYTNVGKSTLLNKLTGADVLVKDQLFATLDPTAREIKLPNGTNAIIIDTVGLVRRLPHQLVEAFKSTLEEAASADIILNVCDGSNPNVTAQLDVTKNLLSELECSDIPMITVYNKMDLLENEENLLAEKNAIKTSFTSDIGVDKLLDEIALVLSKRMKTLNLLIPYSQGALIDIIRKQGKIHDQSFENDGTLIKANVDRKMFHAVEKYIVE